MKNLEDEYRRFHQEETPDLWNRIEAGLTEKNGKPKKPIFTFRRISACAAAVLGVVLLSGAYFLGGQGKAFRNMAAEDKGFADSSSMASMTEVPENRDEASAEDSFLDGDGASCGADDSAQRGDGMSAPADGQEPEETDGKSSDSIQQDACAEETGKDMEKLENSMSGMPQEGNTITDQKSDGADNVQEKGEGILTGNMEVAELAQEDGYTVYCLRTEDGETLSAVQGDDFRETLAAGECYLFTLRKVEDGKWQYVIEAAEAAPSE